MEIHRKAAVEHLVRAERERLILLDNVKELVCTFDLDGRLIYANPPLKKRFDYPDSEYRRLSFPDLLAADEASKWNQIRERLAHGLGYSNVRFLFKTKSGAFVHAIGTLNAVPAPRGRKKIMGVFQEQNGASADSERFFSFAADLLWTASFDGRFQRVNPAFERTLGWRPEELTGRPFVELVHPESANRIRRQWEKLRPGRTLAFDCRFRTRDGTYPWISWSAHSVTAERAVYGVGRDMSHERQIRKKLQELAFTDDLTGLLNRRGFYLFAAKLGQIARRQKKKLLLMIADVDDLKAINDRFGHAEGDAALVCAAEILKGRLRESDVIGRIGGDEFAAALLVGEPSDPRAIKEDLERPKSVPGCSLRCPLTLSIGFSCACSGGDMRHALKDLMREADRMLYQEKTLKKRAQIE